MRQVNVHAVDVIGHEGAARAALLPSRGEHEVLHQQLAATVKQFGERAPALGRVENVVLVDAHPRQRAALAGDLVAQVRQLLFARQEPLALGKPFVPGYDRMMVGARPGIAGHGGYLRFHRFGSFLRLFSRFSTRIVRHGRHLMPGVGPVGVTSVTGFRWTR